MLDTVLEHLPTPEPLVSSLPESHTPKGFHRGIRVCKLALENQAPCDSRKLEVPTSHIQDAIRVSAGRLGHTGLSQKNLDAMPMHTLPARQGISTEGRRTGEETPSTERD